MNRVDYKIFLEPGLFSNIQQLQGFITINDTPRLSNKDSGLKNHFQIIVNFS